MFFRNISSNERFKLLEKFLLHHKAIKMNNTSSQYWLNVHLYYSNPLDDFLVNAVQPFLKTITQTGIVSSYFFSRHNHRGAHIRLYLKGERGVLFSIVQPNLLEYFSNYFERYPSQRIEPQFSEKTLHAYRWKSNNSVVFVNYDYQAEDYGGPKGLRLLESQFYASSQQVIRFIKEKKQHFLSYDERIVKAIELHLQMGLSMGLSLKGCFQFFENMFFQPFDSKLLKDAPWEKGQSRTQIIEKEELYMRAFRKQKNHLTNVVFAQWKNISGRDVEMDSDARFWKSEYHKINGLLRYTVQRNMLEKTFGFDTAIIEDAYENKVVDRFMKIFAHHTNNRLGIEHNDESYVYFILKECLKTILIEWKIDKSKVRIGESNTKKVK